ncbi:hypothetical protein [Pseudomonas bohemica]|uniref:hypothetical protein n=1 Tax=Pseudomonas bohemica TaxID=2044872 RepID=UPI000DA60377|nr:hypothetical protein [Pseudomonas bohemica]
MKRTALTGLFLTAALLGSPVFAADDLCGANLQTLKDAQTSSASNLSADTKSETDTAQEQALAAQKAGDDKKCIEITTKAIQNLKNIGSGSEGGTAK